ncbi:MAG TPA: iron ABC transporter permease [Elusimicrobiales bacterium]|nr:iron ABC transporter permease [Elusimicrobiales bacterium]
MKRDAVKRYVILSVLLLAAVFLALTLGAVRIPLGDLLLATNRPILDMRLMRVATAMLAGCGLAVSGIALQAVLRNPLAEPYLLGTSSGAGLAAVSAMALGVSAAYLPLAAFAGAMASMVLVYGLAREGGRVRDRSLIMAGVIVSIALSALIVFVVSISGERAMREMSWWLWGSTQAYDPRLIGLAAAPVAAGILAVQFFARDLDAISLGEEEALHLGIDVEKLKTALVIVTALMTASLICVCGIIGFVGLIVPHAMRMVAGPGHRNLVPSACLAASAFMVVCDLAARTLFAPVEIPIGVVTALIGAPVFIFLLKKGKRL